MTRRSPVEVIAGLPLFTEAPIAPYRKDSDTSLAAAVKVGADLNRLHHKVLHALNANGPLAPDECALILNLHWRLIRPRYTELSREKYGLMLIPPERKGTRVPAAGSGRRERSTCIEQCAHCPFRITTTRKLKRKRIKMLTLYERKDPRGADELRRRGGAAFRAGVSAKKGAASLGVTERRARQMSEGERTSVVSRFLNLLPSLTLGGGSPFPLVALARSVALQSLMSMTDDQLVSRFWRLMERESEAEGAENTRTALFAHSGDLEALADAMEKEAAVQLEISAVARELKRRGISVREVMLG